MEVKANLESLKARIVSALQQKVSNPVQPYRSEIDDSDSKEHHLSVLSLHKGMSYVCVREFETPTDSEQEATVCEAMAEQLAEVIREHVGATCVIRVGQLPSNGRCYVNCPILPTAVELAAYAAAHPEEPLVGTGM